MDVMVRVEPVRREWAEALAEGDAVFAQRFGIPVEAGWSGFPEALPILLQAATSGVPGEWGPQLFFDDDGALVGNGGWKGRPPGGSSRGCRAHARRGKRVNQGADPLQVRQDRGAGRSR